MFKFWQIARVVKGHKEDFEPTELTKALAKKKAKKDAKKSNGKLTEAARKALLNIPYVV